MYIPLFIGEMRDKKEFGFEHNATISRFDKIHVLRLSL